MNKSLLTNILAGVVLAIGFLTNNALLTSVGLFAVSGAVTNWLAVYMLFEKVPGLYGSGVIPTRFEDFKIGIRTLMMEQFFTDENIERFVSGTDTGNGHLNLTPVIEKINFEPTFDSLIDVIQNSKFGGMLAMVGGVEVLEPLREPYVTRIKQSFTELADSDQVQAVLKAELKSPDLTHEIKDKAEAIVQRRLDELTPQLVKEIIQKMIREHLGWLVVWGGVFGGLIGFIAHIVA